MSLQGIFDPMVRAYFEKESGGGSGGAPDTGVIAFSYVIGEHESATSDALGDVPMVKIFEPVDLIGTGGGALNALNFEMFAALSVQSMDVGINCAIVSDEETVGYVVDNDLLEETGLPSAGLWMVSDFFGQKSICFLFFAQKRTLG